MWRSRWSMMLLTALFIGGGLSFFASSSPDGLEKIAQIQGFPGAETRLSGILAEYRIPGVGQVSFSVSLAGLVGTVFVFGMLFFLGKYLYRSGSLER